MFTPRAFFFFLYVAAVITSSFYSELKYKSLNFHTRDYAYYVQFSSKLLDSNMAKSYSLNPEGYNWLRYYGTEGADNFHRSLHFEPIKYVYVVLYYVAHTPRVLFWFASLIYFLPVLYLAFAVPRANQWFVALVALLYVLVPPALLTPAYDLRPYVFLAPFFFMSLIAIRFARPLWERFLWFNCLFLAREEALILAPTLILLAIVLDEDDSLHRKTVWGFSIASLIWGMLTLAFFNWTGYPRSSFPPPSGLVPILILGGIVLLAIAVGFARKLREQSSWRGPLQMAAYVTVFIPLGLEVFNDEQQVLSSSSTWIAQTLFSPRYALHWVALLGLLLMWRKRSSDAASRPQLLVLGSVAVIFLTLGILAQSGVVRMSGRYLRELEAPREVIMLRESTNKYQSHILVDYATHQAFADYQNVYVHDRLPWAITPGPGRYYPANNQAVQTLVDEKVEFIVASKESAATVEDFLVSSHQQGVRLFENEKFFGVRIVRH